MLVRSSSNAARSRNIAQLRRDGYPPKQAAAIAYRIQRQEKTMSRKLSRRSRRDRGLAYANPMRKGAVGTALGYLGAGIIIGGGLGAIGGAMSKPADVLGGAISGGSAGVGLTALGGFIVGLVSPQNRDAGFAAAGIGFGSLLAVNLTMNLANATKA